MKVAKILHRFQKLWQATIKHTDLMVGPWGSCAACSCSACQAPCHSVLVRLLQIHVHTFILQRCTETFSVNAFIAGDRRSPSLQIVHDSSQVCV